MGVFSSTQLTPKLSMGNRAAYRYKLTNVQATGSILYTPFKKITGYIIETTTPATAAITVSANTDSRGGNGSSDAYLTFAVDAEASGYILVVGLL